jgi:hypothetical protein
LVGNCRYRSNRLDGEIREQKVLWLVLRIWQIDDEMLGVCLG